MAGRADGNACGPIDVAVAVHIPYLGATAVIHKAYVGAKLERPTARWLVDPSVTLDVELSDLFGPRRGQDKQCEILLSVPHGNVLRIQEVQDDLYAAIDAAGDRLVHTLERYKGKKLLGGRYPKKYYVARCLNGEGSSKPTESGIRGVTV